MVALHVEPSAAGESSFLLRCFEEQDTNFHDCIISCSDDSASFRCHRTVLCGSSAVFNAAFTSNMQEAQQRAMRVATDDAAVLKLLLMSVYGAVHLEVGGRFPDHPAAAAS
jgi:hypothetical protein